MIADPVFILTTGHSGSSAFARVLFEAGAWSGRLFEGEGGKYFGENYRFLLANQFLLEEDSIAYKPFDQSRYFSPWLDGSFASRLRREDLKRSLGLPSAPAVPVLKDPRTSLTWPVWNEVFPDAKWIVLSRNMDDVCKVPEREKMEPAFRFRRESITRAILTVKGRLAYVNYEEFNLDTLVRLCEFCGLSTDRAEAAMRHWKPK